ncbi:hypothetical protein [Angustibacter sp. Root456]|uniref:hypothetical protein n=1 Tax=Angustibacter sp. Root456 TaxID=1736539 RepID=UPI00070004A9|nr:hypothetical protein [Angustibacter sp. Root456]KQX61746.1 hypothetical protein ASD06_14265 [Angustibacter sp. Root456]
MKQYLLVAGVDYEFSGVDFRQLADNRRRLLDKRNTARVDLRFTTMDVRSGEVEVREVTFGTGKRVETVTSSKPFTPVTKGSYQDVGGHRRFKPGQPDVMSITDVYQRVQDIGTKDAGTLAELSIFSHGWMGGPILVNSDDDRLMTITLNPPVGQPIHVQMPVAPTSRDPDDKDGRGDLDFSPPTMDAGELKAFRAAFAKDAVAWLWGCAFPRAIHHTMWAMEQAKGYAGVGLGDDVELHLTQVVEEDVVFLDRFLAGVLKPFPKPRSAIRVKFKHLKYALCRANLACYARALADGAQVTVHAAALGTYAEYDTGGDRLMHVHGGFTAHFTFYKNYLGFSFDPEGRKYAVYRPGLACPKPTP